jgi:hypothetical protein
VLNGIPVGSYKVRVSVTGFAPYLGDIALQAAVPVVDTEPTATNTLDRWLITGLPTLSPDSGLNDAIMYTTPGVAADSNGFFHPMGDHAQVSYVIDGQPVSDQCNKVFSTSIPALRFSHSRSFRGTRRPSMGTRPVW